jgi:pilus assembly protein Flp/PilA
MVGELAPDFEDRRSEMFKRFVKLMNDSKGATAIEYGLIAALIAVAAIGAMRSIGDQLGTTFNNVSSELKAG